MPRPKAQQRPEPLPERLRLAELQEQVGCRLVVQQRNAAHRLDTAGNNGVGLAKLNQLSGRGDGLHSGSAIALNRVSDAFLRNARLKGDYAGNVGGVRREGDVAE